MSKEITLIKLGGSLITNKSKPFTLKEHVLEDVVGQLARAYKKGNRFIIGHGSGSFGHVPAEKYQTHKGRLEKQSDYGAAVVADAAFQINRLVVSELLKQELPVVTISPMATFISDPTKSDIGNVENIKQAFNSGMIPVVYGDVILDREKGYTIWSCETVLNAIASRWDDNEVSINKVIHTGEPDGFMIGGEVVPEINTQNFEEMKQEVFATEGFDVTGGMLHKVEESLRLAQEKQIDSYIIGGNHGGNLYRCIVGEEFVGTKVTR